MIKLFLSGLVGVFLGGASVYAVMSQRTPSAQPVVQEVKTQQVAGAATVAPEVISIDSATEVKEDETRVGYTPTGFSPKAIRIKAGTMVTFENQTNQKMWVFSESEGFNQDRVGIEYAHEFEKPGVYNYFNQENPKDQGTIFVE